MFNLELFQSNLKTQILGKKNFYYASTSSTNDDIWKIFNKAKQEGVVVVANEQLEGRGRGNKKWHSYKNKSLICSFLIKQKFPISKLGFHSLIVPLGIIEGINKTTNKTLSIKWPNDIMYKTKKIGGVLIESKNFQKNTYLNIGFGINVNENDVDYPSEIKNDSNSLKKIVGEEIQREILLANILNAIDKLLVKKNEKEIIGNWINLCSHINKEINVIYKKNIIQSIFKTINKNGQAILHYNNNDITFDGPILNI